MSGGDLINEERRRQVRDLGFTPEQDVENHPRGELIDAAMAYVVAAITTREQGTVATVRDLSDWGFTWPTAMEAFKPSELTSLQGVIENLQKAGALIAAEIDRVNRVQALGLNT